jgi:hypothetical protein
LQHKLEWVAPIFLIALLVQFLAPVAAAISMGVPSDPLRAAPICAALGGGSTHQAPLDRHPSDCCTFCAVAHAPLAPADAGAPAVNSNAPVLVASERFAAIPPALQFARTPQARAPPALS